MATDGEDDDADRLHDAREYDGDDENDGDDDGHGHGHHEVQQQCY